MNETINQSINQWVVDDGWLAASEDQARHPMTDSTSIGCLHRLPPTEPHGLRRYGQWALAQHAYLAVSYDCKCTFALSPSSPSFFFFFLFLFLFFFYFICSVTERCRGRACTAHPYLEGALAHAHAIQVHLRRHRQLRRARAGVDPCGRECQAGQRRHRRRRRLCVRRHGERGQHGQHGRRHCGHPPPGPHRERERERERESKR